MNREFVIGYIPFIYYIIINHFYFVQLFIPLKIKFAYFKSCTFWFDSLFYLLLIKKCIFEYLVNGRIHQSKYTFSITSVISIILNQYLVYLNFILLNKNCTIYLILLFFISLKAYSQGFIEEIFNSQIFWCSIINIFQKLFSTIFQVEDKRRWVQKDW